jgi:hypothetical protein
MLEIIVLIILGYKIGNLAVIKGLEGRKWKITFIGCWLAAEFFGILIASMFTSQLFPIYVIGIGCGLTAYLLINNYLVQLPNKV